jgi:GMP synthase-like glutamine amidotransferase
MRVLFVQHDHVSPVGPVGERFAERGFDVDELLVVPRDQRAAPGVEVEFPDPTAYDVVVPMGSPWSVYDESLIGSWVQPELAFLRRAHQQGVSVLGICFGGQALAAALGGSVVPAAETEIGWYTVDTWAPELIEPGPWFQWHSDRWEAPATARTLARSAVSDQAFVVGTSLAVQFHPEVTPSMLAGWLDNGGAEYLRARGLDVAALVSETEAQAAAAGQRAHRLVDGFLDLVARPPALPGAGGRAGVEARADG